MKDEEQSMFDEEVMPDQSSDDYFEALHGEDTPDQTEARHDYTEAGGSKDVEFGEAIEPPDAPAEDSSPADEDIATENKEGPTDRLKNKVDEIRDDLRDRF